MERDRQIQAYHRLAEGREAFRRDPLGINVAQIMRETQAGTRTNSWEAYSKRKIGEKVTILKKFTADGNVSVFTSESGGPWQESSYGIDYGKRELGEGFLQVERQLESYRIHTAEIAFLESYDAQGNPTGVEGTQSLIGEFKQVFETIHPSPPPPAENPVDQAGEIPEPIRIRFDAIEGRLEEIVELLDGQTGGEPPDPNANPPEEIPEPIRARFDEIDEQLEIILQRLNAQGGTPPPPDAPPPTDTAAQAENDQLTALNERLDELFQQNEDLRTQNETILTQLREMQGKVDTLTTENENLTQRIEEISSGEADRVNALITAAFIAFERQRREQEEQTNVALARQFEGIDTALGNIQSGIDEMPEEIDRKIADIRAENVETQQELSYLSRDLNDLAQEFRDGREPLDISEAVSAIEAEEHEAEQQASISDGETRIESTPAGQTPEGSSEPAVPDRVPVAAAAAVRAAETPRSQPSASPTVPDTGGSATTALASETPVFEGNPTNDNHKNGQWGVFTRRQSMHWDSRFSSTRTQAHDNGTESVSAERQEAAASDTADDEGITPVDQTGEGAEETPAQSAALSTTGAPEARPSARPARLRSIRRQIGSEAELEARARMADVLSGREDVSQFPLLQPTVQPRGTGNEPEVQLEPEERPDTPENRSTERISPPAYHTYIVGDTAGILVPPELNPHLSTRVKRRIITDETLDTSAKELKLRASAKRSARRAHAFDDDDERLERLLGIIKVSEPIET